jgi:hypothetical protein
VRPGLALGLACAAIGVLPAVFVGPVLLAGAAVAGEGWGTAALGLGDVVSDAGRISLVALALLAAGAVFWLVRRRALTGRSVRVAETWGCGYPRPTERMQYTASSFVEPLASVFGGLAGVRRHRGAAEFHSTPVDLVLDGLVLPVWTRVERLALHLRPMQQGRLHVYLIYIVAALAVLLAWLVVAPGP